jgi:hypothetical protein
MSSWIIFFSFSVGCFFTVDYLLFCSEAFWLDVIQLVHFWFCLLCCGPYPENHCLYPFLKVFPVIYSSSFRVPGLPFRSVTHLQLICLQDESSNSCVILMHVDIQFLRTIYWRGFPFSSVCFWHLCQFGWEFLPGE